MQKSREIEENWTEVLFLREDWSPGSVSTQHLEVSSIS